MTTDPITLGRIIIYRHEGSDSIFSSNNAEDQAIIHQFEPIVSQLVKEQYQYLPSPVFEDICRQWYEAIGKPLHVLNGFLSSLANYMEPHFSESNLQLSKLVMVEMHGVPVGEELKDAILLLVPGSHTMVLDREPGLEDSGACRVCPSLAKPDFALLFLQESDPELRSLSFISKGLLPYQIHYLKEKLMGVRPLPNSFHQTADMMQLSNTLIREFLPADQVDKTERSDLLQRSLTYFKENERFHEDDFSEQVLESVAGPDAIKSFKQAIGMEHDTPIEFEISREAVQKQGRIFKSVLKLDKNFHVYIHGDKRMIERGKDETGRKYYKLYYDQEY